jgi:hypothetical protein
MTLTDIFVKNLKPTNKPIRLTDGGGLYLYLTPSGTKSWRFNYRYQGKKYTLTFGTYPLISLKQARDQLVNAKRLLQSGINPTAQKKAINDAIIAENSHSFEVVAREWFERNLKILAKALIMDISLTL